MYLDYSKLEFDADGIPETPELVLQTMSEKVIGIIPGVDKDISDSQCRSQGKKTFW